jgi:hexosaminidase
MRARLAVALTLLVAPAAHGADLVPELREFTAAPGTWHLREDTHVVARSRGLRAEARRLATDLGVKPARRARRGDVVLARSRKDPQLGAEGYTLRIGSHVRIAAPTAAGVFYGGRTLIQLGSDVKRGTARDWPRYAERALMIDTGRAFFSRRWLAARIRELASLKLNRLHLHFSDNQGLRIQSVTHPEVVTAPALTQADVRRLVRIAAANHVQLVPELDMPGHMQAALATHPEFQLVNALGDAQPDKLDVTNPAARAFALELVDEYSSLFRARLWHIGGDEYLGVFSTPADYLLYPQLEAFADARHGPGADGKDAVLDFVNTVAEHLRGLGIEARAWSDGAGGGSAVALDPRISLEWWENIHSPAPDALVAAGHDIVNTSWWPLYYVTGGPLTDLRAPLESMAEWHPWEFNGPVSKRFSSPDFASDAELSPDEPRQLGASLAVWNDDPAAPGATQAAVAKGIAPRLRILAEKTWGGD